MIQSIKYYFYLIGNEFKVAFIENKFLLLLSALLFIIPMFVGYFFAPYLQTLLNPMVDTFKNRVQEGEIKLTTESIFFNNFYVAMIMYAGAIIVGLITAMLLISNGLFVGYFASTIPLSRFLLLTLPHGIFEIPALIIAGGGGFALVKFLIYFFKDIILPKSNQWGEKPKIIKRFGISLENNINKLSQSLTLFGIAVILLIIAAFIEVNITIGLANFVIGFFIH